VLTVLRVVEQAVNTIDSPGKQVTAVDLRMLAILTFAGVPLAGDRTCVDHGRGCPR